MYQCIGGLSAATGVGLGILGPTHPWCSNGSQCRCVNECEIGSEDQTGPAGKQVTWSGTKLGEGVSEGMTKVGAGWWRDLESPGKLCV